MNKPTLQTLSQMLSARKISSVELTTDCIVSIKKSTLNTMISYDEALALEAARAADARISKGETKPLLGIPMVQKDIFCTKNLLTTCGSKMLANFKSPYDATIVEKFTEVGAVMLGKANMDEFAMGSTNESSYFGPVKNPWDTTRTPGGSSGGSAAAVASNLAFYATGSDTGGSIRQPAAFCGISGLKPTYGLLSRYGMIAYASSLDTVGLFANSALDLTLILQAIAGFDDKDSTSIDRNASDYFATATQPLKSLKIGLPTCYFHDEVEPDIQSALLTAVKVFESMGATIVDVDLTLLPYYCPTYYVIACAEASSNLSRFDGIRYGHRAKATTLETLITRSRAEGFGTEVKRRILTGTHVLSAGFHDAYYVQAQKVRRLIRDELMHLLTSVDVMLGPTTPNCAPKLSAKPESSTRRFLSDIFTVSANLSGLPALSIPGGFNQQGLPIGIQLLGAHFNEALLLQVAHHYQQKTDWHLRQPEHL